MPQRLYTMNKESLVRNIVAKILRQPIKGPGLQEFLESEYLTDYDPGSAIDIMKKQIQNLWFDRVDPQERNIVIHTGSGGMELFQKYAREYADELGQMTLEKLCRRIIRRLI